MHKTRYPLIASLVCNGVVSCCLAIVAQAGVGGAQELSPEVRQHFTAAHQAQDANNFDIAAHEYLAVIHLRPRFAEAYSNLGLIYYVQGKLQQSASVLQEGLRINPALVGANLYLGIDYIKLNHADKSILFLKHAALLDPGNKDVQSWLGTAYWDAGQHWAALQQLRKTAISFPNDPDIMFVLGESYRKVADQEIQSVIRSASGTAYVHQIYGDIYLEQHALAKAEGHYQRALDQDPKLANIHFCLGEVFLRRDELEKAKEQYLLQLHVDPANVPSKARLAEISLLKGEIQPSLEMLDEAIALSPERAASALRVPPSFATSDELLNDDMLGRLRNAVPALEEVQAGPARSLALAMIAARVDLPDTFQQNWTQFQASVRVRVAGINSWDRANESFERQSFNDAEAEIHSWLGTHPQDLKARYLEARIDHYLSLSVLDRVLKSFPDSARSHQLLAQTFEQRDEDGNAIVEYQKVEGLDPTLPGIHFAMGHLLLKDGDFDHAAVELKEELRINPEHPEANAEMGMILAEQGREEDAIEYFKRAITLQPDLWIAHQELGKAYYLQKDYEKALAELKLAITDDPDGNAHYQLGMVYKAMGQSSDANREFEAARKIKSDLRSQAKLQMPEGTKQ